MNVGLWVLEVIGDIKLGFENAWRRFKIHAAKNWDEDTVGFFWDTEPVLRVTMSYPTDYGSTSTHTVNMTNKLGLMLKSDIKYSQLRRYFYKHCNHFAQIGTRGYEIYVEYLPQLYNPYTSDNQVLKLKINLLNNTVMKQEQDYWLIEEIAFDRITWEPQADTSGVDLLQDLENMVGDSDVD